MASKMAGLQTDVQGFDMPQCEQTKDSDLTGLTSQWNDALLVLDLSNLWFLWCPKASLLGLLSKTSTQWRRWAKTVTFPGEESRRIKKWLQHVTARGVKDSERPSARSPAGPKTT